MTLLLFHSHLDTFSVPPVVFLMTLFLCNPVMSRSLEALNRDLMGTHCTSSTWSSQVTVALLFKSSEPCLALVWSVWWCLGTSLGQPSPASPEWWQESHLMILGAAFAPCFLDEASCHPHWVQLFANDNPCAEDTCYCPQHLVVMLFSGTVGMPVFLPDTSG